ncbi:PIN domain-containing protein [Pseudarthrobacter sp. WHRI 8279]|uniref:PIN domain-containing protein n=1 Tax=Pseudarthrobacter sp. WHRI 8279 TaxID=3162566 RepID=UPI0032EE68AE
MTLVVVDANVIIAAYINSDDRHLQAAEIVTAIGAPLYVPVLALAEASYFIDRELGAEAELGLLEAVVDREIVPVYFEDQWERVLELAQTYKSRRLGASDAAVVAAAERLLTSRIASLDQRDLQGIQLADGNYVDLISLSSQL